MPLISSSEDDYGFSSVRVAARVPLSPLSCSALASWLAPFSVFPLSSCIQTQPSPASPQAPNPTGLSRLSSRLPFLAGRRAAACAPLVRGEKPPGST
jgi:hypothetical protein